VRSRPDKSAERPKRAALPRHGDLSLSRQGRWRMLWAKRKIKSEISVEKGKRTGVYADGELSASIADLSPSNPGACLAAAIQDERRATWL
jgi:hypothetical protein